MQSHSKANVEAHNTKSFKNTYRDSPFEIAMKQRPPGIERPLHDHPKAKGRTHSSKSFIHTYRHFPVKPTKKQRQPDISRRKQFNCLLESSKFYIMIACEGSTARRVSKPSESVFRRRPATFGRCRPKSLAGVPSCTNSERVISSSLSRTIAEGA